MPTTLSDLNDLVSRRRASLLLLLMVTAFAALSQHVFKITLPAAFSPTLLVGGMALVVWIGLAWARAEQGAQRARRERRRVAEQHAAFRATVAGFLVAHDAEDELEAEVLRDGLLRRAEALMAARRAMARGQAPEGDAEVLAKTTAGERADAVGHALLVRLASLQREALSAAQRLGLLGEARAAQLDERLLALVPLHAHGDRGEAAFEPTPHPALAFLVTGYAVLLPVVSAQRIAYALVAGGCGAILILFESAAGARRGRETGA